MSLKNITGTVGDVVGAVVGLIKGLIVFFVFANIIYMTQYNPIEGLTMLVDSFLNGGLAGLLVLLVFLSFLD